MPAWQPSPAASGTARVPAAVRAVVPATEAGVGGAIGTRTERVDALLGGGPIASAYRTLANDRGGSERTHCHSYGGAGAPMLPPAVTWADEPAQVLGGQGPRSQPRVIKRTDRIGVVAEI